jgi:hypothetical protein
MRHAVIVLAAVCCCSVLGYSQTAEELVAKNIEAKGGMDKIKAIRSLRSTGRLKAGGFSAQVGSEKVRPDLLRDTMSLQGMTSISAYDGSSGWQIEPFGGHKDPELMGEDDVRSMLLEADFDGPLVDYKEKGNTVDYLGHDVVDGDDALRLKVTLKNGDIIYYYLDPDTFLEIRKEFQQLIRGSVREFVEELGSYKPVNGVMYPFSISQGSKNNPNEQTTTIEKMEANVEIPKSDFALPASLKQAAKTDEKK